MGSGDIHRSTSSSLRTFLAVTTTVTITSILLFTYYSSLQSIIKRRKEGKEGRFKRKSLRNSFSTFIEENIPENIPENISKNIPGYQKNVLEMWRPAGEQNNYDDDDMEIEEEEENEEEQAKQRDIMYNTIIPTASPHGVPSLLKTFDAAVLFLKIARSIDKKLQNNPKIDLFFEYLDTIEQDIIRISRQGYGHLKILIIEGLMSSGKSTLINGLKPITRATAVTSIPANILEIKYLFNSVETPESVTTALDFITNYCIAHQIIQESAGKPNGHLVIVEQFYHATCALSACVDVPAGPELSTLPPSAFEWPLDLPIPHLVIYLTLKTKIRMLRQHVGRGSSLTERSSDRNVTRDARSQTAYSLVTGPSTIALDASQGPEDVLSSALEALEEFGLYTPPEFKGPGSKRMSLGMYGAF